MQPFSGRLRPNVKTTTSLLRSTLMRTLLAGLALAGPQARAACDAEPRIDTVAAAPDRNQARGVLRDLVERARQRSRAIGAGRLLAQAAQSDLEETQAAAKPQSTLRLGSGWAGSNATAVDTRNGLQASAALRLGAPLYDGGRIERLGDWRSRLLDAARFGMSETEEQVTLQTVSLALERSRQVAQTQVFRQYAAQMRCLVDSLEEIVAADRGRASELAQARNALGQAMLQSEQSAAATRQAEIGLARLVGAPLPLQADLAGALAPPPVPMQVQADASQNRGIRQLDAQAQALESYAQAQLAAQGPQLAWGVTLARTLGSGNPAAWAAGLSLDLPLLNPGGDPAVSAARERAEAARLQRDDALEALRQRVAESAEQLDAAFVRARRVDSMLADSERVRDATWLQWQQLGRRSLFDVMTAEGDLYGLRAARVNALHDGQQAAAQIWSQGPGVANALEGR